MSSTTVFTFESKHFVRTIDHNGEVLFVARDVAAALGYARPSKAILDHCKKAKSLKDIGVLIQDTHTDQPLTLDQQIKVIPESDVFRLVMRSELDSAERFQDWVCEDVLPSIRKTGSYSVPAANPIRDEFDMHLYMIERMDALVPIDRTVAITAALSAVDAVHGTRLHATYRSALPAPVATFMDPTALDAALKVPKPMFSGRGSPTNRLLEEHGFQVKEGKGWMPTEKAVRDQHYRMSTYSRHGHSGVSLQWSKEFVESLVSARH